MLQGSLIALFASLIAPNAAADQNAPTVKDPDISVYLIDAGPRDPLVRLPIPLSYDWTTPADYPALSPPDMTYEYSEVDLSIDAKGGVVTCKAFSRRGGKDLGDSSARLCPVFSRSRFIPALDRIASRVAAVLKLKVLIEGIKPDGSRYYFPPAPPSSAFRTALLNLAELRFDQVGPDGSPTVRLSVDDTGTVTACKIIKSTGDDRLDLTACEYAEKTARFRAAQNWDRQPVSGSFKLHLKKDGAEVIYY